MLSKLKVILPAVAAVALLAGCTEATDLGWQPKRSVPIAGRELYYTVTPSASFVKAIAAQSAGASQSSLCAQIVSTNGELMLEASPGPCPTDANGNQTLPGDSAVFVGLFMNTPDSQGRMMLYDPSNLGVTLGYVTPSLGTSPRTYQLGELCTNAYAINPAGNNGCLLKFDGNARATGISEAYGPNSSGGSW